MAPSETVTEKSPGNSARNGKLHIVILVDIWLGSKWASAHKRILKNKMKNVENKAMLKCYKVSQKELANFDKSQNHILNLTVILQGPLH